MTIQLSHWHYSYLLAAASLEAAVEKIELPKGDMWSVHKFGGTCVGSSERIKNVAEIIMNDTSERKLVVVSAMSKVTDMMYDLIKRAESRDGSFMSASDAVLEKHTQTAKDLLQGDELLSFLSRLHDDINNLKAMLRAISIGMSAISQFLAFLAYGENCFNVLDIVRLILPMLFFKDTMFLN